MFTKKDILCFFLLGCYDLLMTYGADPHLQNVKGHSAANIAIVNGKCQEGAIFFVF